MFIFSKLARGGGYNDLPSELLSDSMSVGPCFVSALFLGVDVFTFFVFIFLCSGILSVFFLTTPENHTEVTKVFL